VDDVLESVVTEGEAVYETGGVLAAGVASSWCGHLHTVFQQHELPADTETFTVSGRMTITRVIAAAKLASSKNEARRLIAGDGVSLDGRKVGDPFEVVTPASGGSVLQVGKRRFARLVAGSG
jgi:tyrosyl-tRNA synthetase